LEKLSCLESATGEVYVGWDIRMKGAAIGG